MDRVGRLAGTRFVQHGTSDADMGTRRTCVPEHAPGSRLNAGYELSTRCFRSTDLRRICWPMSLQSERLQLLMQRLGLTAMVHGYEALAEQAVQKNLPYCDFLEQVL